jgi:hypothetical protein
LSKTREGLLGCREIKYIYKEWSEDWFRGLSEDDNKELLEDLSKRSSEEYLKKF